MKKTLLCLFLLVAGAMNAQIVNIPDVALKTQLLTSVSATADINGNPFPLDANGDGEIQQTEADVVYQLNIGTVDVLSYQGIEHFNNAGFIVCNLFNAVPFNFSVMPSVKRILCQGNISNIIINGNQNLEEISFSLNTESTVSFENLPSLKEIIIGQGNYTNLNFHDLPALETIRIIDNPLSELNLANLPALETLRVSENELTTLDLSGAPNLRWIDLGANPLTSVDLSNHHYLTMVGLSSTLIEDVDLSNSPDVHQLTLNYCPNLQHVNVKNGSSPVNTLYMFAAATSSLYICADESDLTDLSAAFGIAGSGAEINTYCTFTPGGDYNTIAGTVIFDGDNNGCDTLDAPIPFSSIQINNGIESGVSFNSNGTYNFYTQAGTFTLTPQFEGDWFNVSPETVTFANNNNNTITQNFCVTANGVHNDAEVTIVPLVPARPGFDAHYKIIYKNKGNQTLSGDVTFTYDDAVLDYVLSTPVENTAATGSLSWSYTNLLPFETREIYVTLNVNSPMETPAVNIDDALNFVAAITPLTGDETHIDNTFGLKQTVVGSFDPNDITCLEGATVNPDKIGEYLHYNINFENTGTFPATFVVVKNLIDAAKFDVSSLVVLDASHNVQTRVTGNKAEFIFDNINLAANGGKGNVAFKIKSLETLAVNSSVMQKANIFFDYNWPIVTNEAVTTYAILNNPDFTKDASVKVYPNPATNVVHIAADSAIQTLQLFDVQGRLLEALTVNDVTATLEFASRATGIYFIKIATEKGVTVEKLIKE
jgi:Secretion system C-terminal sorting domain